MQALELCMCDNDFCLGFQIVKFANPTIPPYNTSQRYLLGESKSIFG